MKKEDFEKVVFLGMLPKTKQQQKLLLEIQQEKEKSYYSLEEVR